MSPTLFLPPQACAEVSVELLVWRVDGDACVQQAFADAVPHQGAWRLIVPVEAVTLCTVQLPTTKARWLAKALPFAVEELLAEDVEQFHLCVGAPLADASLQRAQYRVAELLGMPTLQLLQQRHRHQRRRAFEHRHHLRVPHRSQRVGASSPVPRWPLRRQHRHRLHAPRAGHTDTGLGCRSLLTVLAPQCLVLVHL